MQFRPIEIADRALVSRYQKERDYPGNQFSFGTLFIWRKIYSTAICEEDGSLFVRQGQPGAYSYLCPLGGDFREAVDRLRAQAARDGQPLRLLSLPPEEKEKILALYPEEEVSVSENRDLFDYLYERERLRTLAGRRLQPKRNYLNRIRKKNWSYEPVTADNLDECFAMQKLWCAEHNRCAEESVRAESCAVRQAFSHFQELGFAGGCIRLDGKIIGYTMGEPLNSDTFVVHIEKAFSGIEGAYPLINQQFVEHAMEGFAYVNREDDAGSEGLRKAKLSYDPCRLLENYRAQFRA